MIFIKKKYCRVNLTYNTAVFNIDDVTANDVIQRNQHHKEKKNLNSIVITDIKLASVEERLRILFFISMARTLS